MERKLMIIDMTKKEIMESPLSRILPYLRIISRANNLKLSVGRDFKKATMILLCSAK